MPIGTYTMLKGTKPAFEEKASANYYAYGPSGSVATYKKISGLITLPDKVRLVGTGKGRNAFISLGVTAKGGKRGIDIGLRNRGLGCQNEKLGIDIPSKDAGYGWHPYCIELDNSIDAGYYFDGRKISIRRIRSVKIRLTLLPVMQSRRVLRSCRIPMGKAFTSL